MYPAVRWYMFREERGRRGSVNLPVEGDEIARSGRIWRFGHAQLDEGTLELTVKGKVTALDSKWLQVLMHLLRNAGEIVTKNELAEICWPQRVLSESVLSKTMSRLRNALQDGDQTIIRTVHGYGYRLVAPVTIVQSKIRRAAGRVAYRPGDRHPLRKDWALVSQLGQGSSGEAWLAKQDQTDSLRVFKFPVDMNGLGSLKREITISRLLADFCAERITKLLGWNLELEPYFVEYDYVDGGNLHQWAERAGELLKISMSMRIDIAIQIADTLAIAHSVGVLHKDLKPSNILIETNSGTPVVKLADFGSAVVFDSGKLQALGITRLGFTKTMSSMADAPGTPLYLAPELLAGQPSTVKADIYSLGIILYQLVTGDFRKPLAPGWESDIDDPLLIEDIELAAAGDPSRRFPSAAHLADRLRNLELRRRERSSQIELQNRIQAERRALERMTVRRNWMAVTATLFLAAAATSSYLYLETRKARIETHQAAKNSEVVAEFLSRDVLDLVSELEKPPKEWTVIDLMKSASQKIDVRFSTQPQVAARLHAAVGSAYLTLEETALAKEHLEKAQRIATSIDESSEQSIELAGDLIVFAYLEGRLDQAILEAGQLLSRGVSRWGIDNPAVARLRKSVAWGYAVQGDWLKALQVQREQMAMVLANNSATPADLAGAQRVLGLSLTDAGLFAEAETILRASVDQFEGIANLSEFGKVPARIALIELLIQRGKIREAREELGRIESTIRNGAPSDVSAYKALVMLFDARLLTEEGKFQESIRAFNSIVAFMVPEPFEKIDQRWIVWEAMGSAYARFGDFENAQETFSKAHRASMLTNGEGHPITARISIGRAAALVKLGRHAEGRAVLDSVSPTAMKKIPEVHPIHADRLRVEAALRAEGYPKAPPRQLLQRALAMYETTFGPAHQKTVEAAQDLRNSEPDSY
jgi:eukaryotic-like serine/threonine-protein kinase